MKINQLTITQETLRDSPEEMAQMIEFVQKGGFWVKDALVRHASEIGEKPSPLICLNEFPDGMIIIHDGHHRIVATHLGGRDFLRSDEYELTHRTYEQYMEINWANHWVTPFDPRVEVRVADFYDFRNSAFALLNRHFLDGISFIKNHRHSYALTRRLFTVEDLAKSSLQMAHNVV